MDEIVIMEDSNSVRGNWTIKRINNIFPERNDNVWNFKVEMPTSEYQRPITKIEVIDPSRVYDTRTDQSTKQFRMRKLPSLGQRGVPS